MTLDCQRIDSFCHITPPKFREHLYKVGGDNFFAKAVIDAIPTLWDLNARFRLMDKYEVMHVINLAFPPPEHIADKKEALDLAQRANDEMAELVIKHPDYFAASIAALPMNDMDLAIQELDRCVKELRCRGVQIGSNINDKPLDSPEFFPLYEKMQEYNLPILIHPHRDPDHADYRTEKRSVYRLNVLIGWPYETTAAAVRLVLSGVLDKFPDVKFVLHHCGGFVPYFINRLHYEMNFRERMRRSEGDMIFTMPMREYYKKFYFDTAIYGNTSALMCGYDLCGVEKMIFATDWPFDSQFGERYTRLTIKSVMNMDIPDEEKEMIFEHNPRKLFNLTV
jgi:predicted TIM-barrel fold metal-dependent hydrolase